MCLCQKKGCKTVNFLRIFDISTFCQNFANILPICTTKQKAAVNAIVQHDFINIQMDLENCTWTTVSEHQNHCYTKKKYKILPCGTIYTNRKGWDQIVMNLLNSATKAESKIYCDPINAALFGQW